MFYQAFKDKYVCQITLRTNTCELFRKCKFLGCGTTLRLILVNYLESVKFWGVEQP